MVTIEIIQLSEAQEKEPTVKETIQIEGIEPSRITPVNAEVGIPIPMTNLSQFIPEIEAIEQLNEEEPESYYTQDVPVYDDGNLSLKNINLPHHIGLRVVLESLLQKFGKCKDLYIQIS